MNWVKKAFELAAGLMIFTAVILAGVSVKGGMPLNLLVYACESTKEFYAPTCQESCTQMQRMSVHDAFGHSFGPSNRCLSEGWFDEYEISLGRELLDKAGIIYAHPWNSDGTWRSRADAIPLKARRARWHPRNNRRVTR